MARSISTASSAASAHVVVQAAMGSRLASSAIVHATGSHDTTTISHFDAQDYMESATPGVKSTKDGWLRIDISRDQGAGIRDHGNPLRGIALTKQMPRSMQGAAPALAIGSTEDFTVADMSARRRSKRSTPPLNRTGAARRGRRGLRRHAHARQEDRRTVSAGERRVVSALAVRPGPTKCRLAKSDSASRSRLRKHAVGPSRSTRARRHRTNGQSSSTTSRAASPLSPRTLAIEWPTPSS